VLCGLQLVEKSVQNCIMIGISKEKKLKYFKHAWHLKKIIIQCNTYPTRFTCPKQKWLV